MDVPTQQLPPYDKQALARHLLSCQAVLLSSDHQSWLIVSTCGLFDLSRGGSVRHALHGPGQGRRRHQARTGGPASLAPVLWCPRARRAERVAQGRGLRRTYRCAAALRPGRAAAANPRAPPAPPVRGGGGSAGGRPGPCGNPPVPGCASLLPAPPHPPAGIPSFPSRCHIPRARLQPSSPPAATASGSAHGCSPFMYGGTSP